MQWSIKLKLFLGFGLAAILLCEVAGVAWWARVHAQATQVQIEQTLDMLNDLEYLISYVRGVTVAQRAFMISGNPDHIAGIPAMRKDADVVAAKITAEIKNKPEELQHFNQYLEYVRQRRIVVNNLNTARKNQGFDAAKAIFDTGEDMRLLAGMIDEFGELKKLARAELAAENAADQALQRRIAWTEGLSVLVALLLLTAISMALARSVRSNVGIAVEMVGQMAEKDLSGPDGEPSSNDELAVAILAINRMKQSMTAALSEVARSSAQVAAAGTEIEASAQEIASTTHQEQSHVELFASSLAEMNATVKDVAEHAERASLASSDAVDTATRGRDQVRQTHAAMNRIHQTVSAASGDIANLGAETQSIGDVVRIIQEIAEQTNLLALNAAIEAARAGEQGKGFAVVAQEVRALAERTGKFTKEIAGKVESVQQGADRAIRSMREGEAVVDDGVKQFNLVSDALDAIVERIGRSQEGIAMIATATTQQSAATEGLTESIHNISAQVSRASVQVDQTAMACQELAKLASALQSVVDGFRLPEERRDRPSPDLRRRR